MRIRLPDFGQLMAFFGVFLVSIIFMNLCWSAPTPLPSVIAALQGFAVQPTVQSVDFFTALTQSFVAFGGASWALKVTMIIMLLIASMKVSFLDKLIWDKLGRAQALVAPLLGLIGGLLVMGLQSNITLPGIFAYLAAGAGAIGLHEILDWAKAIPGLGAGYVSLINSIEGALGGNPVGTQDAKTATALTGASVATQKS